MRPLALAVLSLPFLAACQTATTEMTEEQKAEIAAEVTAVNADMWDAWRAADFETGMSYFYDSPDFAFAMEGEMINGYSEVDATFRLAFVGLVSQDIMIPDSRATVLAPDVVCIMEAGSYTATDTAGATTPEAGFAITTIWTRHDGEWKVRFVHESYPAAESQ